MSDIFAGLQGGFRFPDTQMNVGPLPSIAGGPAGSGGDPDGRINFNGNLLEGIQPYSYAEAARMGSDRNYQQIPHRMQHIIPVLYLPHADPALDELVSVSHAVDMGDVAFLIGTSRIQRILFDSRLQNDAAVINARLPARNAFCNLSTVNYLLAGLQRISPTAPGRGRNPTTWSRLAVDLDFRPDAEHPAREILKLVKTGFIPYGVCAGSEHQGGKHETGLAPVQGAVNHVTTMTVDGQNRDLVNFWRRCDLDAGDQIIYRLEYLPTRHYTLNHYYKGVVHQSFPETKICWQLVPDVFRMTHDPALYENCKARPCDWMAYDYRLHGYWRIGQMFHHRGRTEADVKGYADDTVFLRGQLLHVTFAPVWVEFERPPASHRRLAGTKRPLPVKYVKSAGGDDSSDDEEEKFPTVHRQTAVGGGNREGERREGGRSLASAAPAVRFMNLFATLDPTAPDPPSAVSAASQAPPPAVDAPAPVIAEVDTASPATSAPVVASQPDVSAASNLSWDSMQDLSIDAWTDGPDGGAPKKIRKRAPKSTTVENS